jgi:hypothetical protein
MGTYVIPLLQQGSDRSSDHMVSKTLATTWLLERRSTSPVLLTIPAIRCHSPDLESYDHIHYEKLSKTGHCFNLHDYGDKLMHLTRAVLPPLHLEEQAKLTLDPCSLQSNPCSPGLESIPKEDSAC